MKDVAWWPILRNNQRGAILVYVLILFLVLSLVAAALIRLSVLEHHLAANEIERQQLFYGADSGATLARLMLESGYQSTEREYFVFYLDDIRVEMRLEFDTVDADAEGEAVTAAVQTTASKSGGKGYSSQLGLDLRLVLEEEHCVRVESYKWLS